MSKTTINTNKLIGAVMLISLSLFIDNTLAASGNVIVACNNVTIEAAKNRKKYESKLDADINIHGSNALSDEGVLLIAGGDANFTAAKNTYATHTLTKPKNQAYLAMVA